MDLDLSASHQPEHIRKVELILEINVEKCFKRLLLKIAKISIFIESINRKNVDCWSIWSRLLDIFKYISYVYISFIEVFNFKYKYAMTYEPYGLWIMAVLRTRQDVIKFALLYLPIGGMSSNGKFKGRVDDRIFWSYFWAKIMWF